MKTGKVYLVGAGPGDPELLTIKAVRVLGNADVVLVDDLVHRDVLLHTRADARIVHVGKRGGCASTPQAFIERLMIAEARAGRRVVRLKGGDPGIFGRAGEEVDALRDAGIEVEIVNGLTSGLAAATAAGIPLTHRAHAHGVAFVTGHAASSGAPDWAALARSGLTLVVYMAVSRAADIAATLLDAGMRPQMPVMIVERATCAGERCVPTRLDDLAHTVCAEAIASPAIIIVGEVAGDACAQSIALAERAARR